MTKKEIVALETRGRINAIEEVAKCSICDMVEQLIRDKQVQVIKNRYFIPLHLSSFEEYSGLRINKNNHKRIVVASLTNSVNIDDAIIELQVAIMTTLAIDYFEVEDI